MFSCNGQHKKAVSAEKDSVSKNDSEDNSATKKDPSKPILTLPPPPPTYISQFVRRIHEDKNGDMWFGTNGDGVARNTGNSLKYFSSNEGFGGVAVRGIVEDELGNIWFGSNGGITKYDGKTFVNYTEEDGLVNNDVWSIFIDKDKLLWIATLQGVCTFDGTTFTPFALPETKPDYARGVTSAKIIHSIMQDSKGNMWFGGNGGAFVYDGTNLKTISEKDGLCNNAVNSILEDLEGNIWFATHHNGICMWDGKSFTNITEENGVEGTETWDLFLDSEGDIWFPMENFGIYRYNRSESIKNRKISFTNFYTAEGLSTNAIQCTFQDRDGQIWFGGYQGLFKYVPENTTSSEGKSIISVDRTGPWDN